MSLKQLSRFMIKYRWKQSANPLFEFKYDYNESESSNSSTTETMSRPFALNSYCTFGWDKIWFHLTFTFLRLARSPLLQIPSTKQVKQKESVFQSVFLSSKRALPLSYKLRYFALHFWLNPEVHEPRAVDQQKLNTILCESLAALMTSAGLRRWIRCIWSKSLCLLLLQPLTANCVKLRFHCRVTICDAVDCEQTQTVEVQSLSKRRGLCLCFESTQSKSCSGLEASVSNQRSLSTCFSA